MMASGERSVRNSSTEPITRLMKAYGLEILATTTIAFLLTRLLTDFGGTSAPALAGVTFTMAGIGILLAIFRKPTRDTAISVTHLAVLISVVLFCALQLTELPLSLVRLLSPARAELAAALPGAGIAVPHWIALSAAPGAGGKALTILCLCVLVHFLAALAGRRSLGAKWLAVSPVVALAVLQASSVFADSPVPASSGSFVDRNHFCAFLEMALPFAIMLLSPSCGGRWKGLRVTVAAIANALLLNGIFRSGSRMGFLSACLALSICGAACFGHHAKTTRRVALCGGLALGLLLLFLAAPPAMRERLSNLGGATDLSARSRWGVWHDSLPFSLDYPLVGSGLGSFDSVFLKYQRSSVEYRFDHAHNDYLEWIVETGLPGTILLIAGLAAIFRTLRRALDSPSPDDRNFAIACGASLAAIGLHSMGDFSLRLPVNALACAWIAGLVPGYACRSARMKTIRSGALRLSIGFVAVLLLGLAIQNSTRASANAEPSRDRAGMERLLLQDPANAYLWADLADSFHDEGDTLRATQCFRRAAQLAPDQPRVLVRAAEYFTSVGDRATALSLSRRVLEKTRIYDRNVFDLLDWYDVHPAQFLATMNPDSREAVVAYLDHRISTQQLQGCDGLWEWLFDRHAVTDPLAGEYVEALSVQSRDREAMWVWMRYLGPRAAAYVAGNRIFNGGFEQESTHSLFDWRTLPVDGIDIARDSEKQKSGSWSLRITTAPRFRLLYNATIQTLILPSGRYHFTAAVWNTSGDPESQFVFQFVDPQAPELLNVHTLAVPGTHGWQRVETSFRVSPSTPKVVLALFRADLSQGNSGVTQTQWIDDLRLESVNPDYLNQD